MALPKIEVQWAKAKLIGSKKEIRFRPFKIKDQKKVMLIKSAAKDDVEIYKGIIDMVQSCIEGEKVENMWPAELERLFYDIRSLSDGNDINFKMDCRDKKCKFNSDYVLNTRDDLELSNTEFEKNFPIKGTNIVVNFRQPKIKDVFN